MADEKKNVPGPDDLGPPGKVDEEAATSEAAAIVDRKLDDPDYTADTPAPGRILVISLPFFKYGTSDRFQGAAVLLSIVLLGVIAILLTASFIIDIPDGRFDKIFSWLGGTFLLVMGVAIGRASTK